MASTQTPADGIAGEFGAGSFGADTSDGSALVGPGPTYTGTGGTQTTADKNEILSRLLTFAQAMGFFHGDPAHPWDANHPETLQAINDAVSEYQRRRGLPVSGEIDDRTTSDVDAFGRFLAGATQPAVTGESGGMAGHWGVPGHPTGTIGTPSSPGAGSEGSGGAGTSSAPGGDAGNAGATTGGVPNPDGKFGIPGGGKIWAAPDGFWYVVYTIPGTTVPLAWRIDSNDDVAAIFGPGNEWKVDRTLTKQEWESAGILTFGSSRLLANTSEHPFDAFVANFAKESSIRPWLKDPEILAITTRALLEGREVSDAELATTHWWQTHTEGERAWIAEFNRDPATAQQKITDGHEQARQMMIAAGITDPPEQLVTLIGNRMTAGTWTQAYVQAQVRKLADPASSAQLDTTLGTWVGNLAAKGITLNTLADNTSKVDKLILQELGPVYAKSWTTEQRQKWASRLRNDPNGEEDLLAELKRQRVAVYPEYQNPELSYDDIAAPWRGVWSQMWGQAPDETSSLFEQVIKLNDRSAAEELLRREGLARNNSTVRQSAISAVASSDLGGGVRGVL